MNSRTTYRLLPALLLVALLVVTTSGCGGGDDESAAEFQDGMTRLSWLNFDKDGIVFRETSALPADLEEATLEESIQQWREEVEKTGGYVSARDLPPNFPDAFPLYEGSRMVLGSLLPTLGFIVVWDIDDPPQQVMDFYQRAFDIPDGSPSLYSGRGDAQLLKFDLEGTPSHVAVGTIDGRDTLVLWIPK